MEDWKDWLAIVGVICSIGLCIALILGTSLHYYNAHEQDETPCEKCIDKCDYEQGTDLKSCLNTCAPIVCIKNMEETK